MQNRLLTFLKLSNPARLRSTLMYLGLSTALIMMAALMPRKTEEKQKPDDQEKEERKEVVVADISDRIY